MIKILKNPITIVLSAGMGILFGFYFKDFALKFAPLGNAYLRFLQMCVIPILVSAITLGIGELTLKHSEKIKKIWWKIMLSFLSLFVVGAFAVIGGLIMKPGEISNMEIRNEIGKIISNFDQIDLILSFDDRSINEETSVFERISNQIPNNIFESLLEGKAMQLVIFSIIFGIAIGLLSDKRKSEKLLKSIDSIFDSFKKILDIVLLLLPVGLFALIAEQVAKMGLSVFSTMANFIIIFYIVSFVVILISTVAIAFFSKKSFFFCVRVTFSYLITAFSTRSSLVAMPMVGKTLSKNLGYDEKSSSLYISP